MKAADVLRSYANILASCSACGLCQAVCPVYGETHRESDSPRGHVLVLRALLAGDILQDRALASLNTCLLCGRCGRACPAGLPLEQIFLAARSAQPLPVNRQMRMFFAMDRLPPKMLDRLQSGLAVMQNGLYYAAKKIKRKGPALPVLARRPFVPKAKEKEENQAKKRIVLFPGCIGRRFLPEMLQACEQALMAQGYEVLVPERFVCCGRPQAATGRMNQVARAARINLEILSDLEFDLLTSPCPGCLSTIVKIWPQLERLSANLKKKAQLMAAKTTDIGSLLQNCKAVQLREEKIFWHRPCLLDDTAAGAFLPGIGQAGADLCCGAAQAGLAVQKKENQAMADKGWGISQPPVVHGRRLRDEILASGAEVVATGCPACILRIRKMLSESARAKIPVRHYVELYVRSIQKEQQGNAKKPEDKNDKKSFHNSHEMTSNARRGAPR